MGQEGVGAEVSTEQDLITVRTAVVLGTCETPRERMVYSEENHTAESAVALGDLGHTGWFVFPLRSPVTSKKAK